MSKNNFFTSDLHLSHNNIAGKLCSKWSDGFRIFDNANQMNDVLIDNINKYVGVYDTLYILGDFAFSKHTKIPALRDRINCENIHFIKGNHDNHIDLYKDSFLSINDVLSINIGGVDYFLSHYAHRVWNKSHRGVIHLYGHSHSSIPDFGKSMDVGVDVAYKLFGEYRPFNVDEINKIMSKREISKIDHHI